MALTTHELIHQMYIAYYQRMADPGGLKYWAEQIGANGWPAVAAAFANAPESADLYGGKSKAEIVEEIYASAFNRVAVQVEIDWWVASEHSAANLSFAIVNGAQNDDLATIRNKITFSSEFVDLLDEDGDGDGPFAFKFAGAADAAAGRDMMAQVTADPASIILAKNAVGATLQAQIFVSDLQSYVASAGDHNFILNFAAGEQRAANIEGFGPGDQITLANIPTTSNYFFTSDAPDAFDFGIAGHDFASSWAINFQNQSTTLVADIKGQVDSVSQIGVLDAAWGDWLVA